MKRKGGGNQSHHNRAQTAFIIYNHIDTHGRMASCLHELDTEDVSCNDISGRNYPYQQDIFLMHRMKTKLNQKKTQGSMERIRYIYEPTHPI